MQGDDLSLRSHVPPPLLPPPSPPAPAIALQGVELVAVVIGTIAVILALLGLIILILRSPRCHRYLGGKPHNIVEKPRTSSLQMGNIATSRSGP